MNKNWQMRLEYAQRMLEVGIANGDDQLMAECLLEIDWYEGLIKRGKF